MKTSCVLLFCCLSVVAIQFPEKALSAAPTKRSTASADDDLRAEEEASIRGQTPISEFTSDPGSVTQDPSANSPAQAPGQTQSSAAKDIPAAVDLGPEEDAARKGIYRRPPGPVQGGILRVPHPGTAQGLIRINKDGTYQYKVPLRSKSQAISVRIGLLTPPLIGGQGNVTFKTMYGSGHVFALSGEYEWDPFQKYGAWGIQLGTGFATLHGSGTLNLNGHPPAQEAYDLFIVPMSTFLIYRFEYVRRQWIVPFINGGGTYYGLAERRDDGKQPKFAGAAAVGGGGGFHFSISRIDPAGAFTLDREYGIADMWLTLEARAMQGLKPDMDFTSQMISAGITVDF